MNGWQAAILATAGVLAFGFVVTRPRAECRGSRTLFAGGVPYYLADPTIPPDPCDRPTMRTPLTFPADPDPTSIPGGSVAV